MTFRFQITDGLERFSGLLREKNDKRDSSVCSFWVDVPTSASATNGSSGCYSEFWDDEFLTDLTLRVGPNKAPIRVHRVVLAAHFEYFRSMFSSGLKESSSNEVYLPFVGPEDLKLILRYAYIEQIHLSKDNVFKLAVLDNFLGSKNLMNRCCDFVKQFINLQNCIELFEATFEMGISQLRKNCLVFIVDHLQELSKDDLSALPVDLILEIIQHPAAVASYSATESEKQLFHIIWNKVKSFPEEQKTQWIPKVLKATHLPLAD